MAEDDIIRRLLTEVDRDPSISQKRLADEIGISVGAINWHVKRCASKGLIKLQQAPIRRYLYYLTPEGFSEKANLTARYLQSSFNIFREGREQYGALFAECNRRDWKNIALVGKSELTELANMIAISQNKIQICAVIDPAVPSTYPNNSKGQTIDAFILTHFLTTGQSYQDSCTLIENLGYKSDRLLTPEFLQ